MVDNEGYAKVIFLNRYQKGMPLLNNDQYQRYFIYQFNLTNPRKFHERLISEGYLQSAPIDDYLDALKISELKVICDSLGAKKTGNKAEIVNRIKSEASSQQIKSYFSDRILYSLSPKGLTFLNDNQDYIELFRYSRWEISLEEYNTFKGNTKINASYNDIAWEIFNKRIARNPLSYSLLRNTFQSMSELLNTEKKYDMELLYLLSALFIDVSGSENLNLIDLHYYSKEELYEMFCTPCFSPGNISRIIELEVYYNPNIIDHIYQLYQYLPIQICPRHLLKEMVDDFFTQATFEEDKYIKQLKNAYKDYLFKNVSTTPQRTVTANISSVSQSCKTTKPKGCLASVMIVFITCFITALLIF